MNTKKNMLIVNTNMVKIFMDLTTDYTIMTASLPAFAVTKKISGCPYIHALIFITKQDRDKAFQIMTQYGIDKKVEYPYVYLGERVTSGMIALLNENHGDFSVWQKGISMTIFEKVKEYFETIDLNRYDLSGCEFVDEDFETIVERVDAGQGTIESVTDDYLYEVRKILDEGLEDIEE